MSSSIRDSARLDITSFIKFRGNYVVGVLIKEREKKNKERGRLREREREKEGERERVI